MPTDAAPKPAVAAAAPQPASEPAEPLKKIPYLHLFRFATASDRLLVLLGCLFAAANGVIFPCFSLLFGQLLNSINSPVPDLTATINRLSLYFLIISLGAALASLLQNALPMLASERQMVRLRTAYMRALLRQPPSWHDTRKDAGEVASRLSADTLIVAGGIGEKLTGGIQHSTTFLAGMIVGFTTSYKLTLIIFCCVPILVGVVVALKNSISRFEKESADAYAKAGDAAGEGISLIRAVSASGGEEHEVARYDKHLKSAEDAGVAKGFVMAACVGGIFGTMFLTYAVAMGAGAQFVLDSRASNPLCRDNPIAPGCFSGGDVIQTFMAVLIGAFALGQAGPNIAALGSAQAAAYHLWAVCDEAPVIDVEDSSGHRPAVVLGKIEFKGVSFRYPSRPEEKVLDNFSLLIPAGQNIALVGESGSGKSTLIALLLRFYDVEEGLVLLDDVDVRKWNTHALRAAMGYVAQDPLLFSASVATNISMGRVSADPRVPLPPPSAAEIEAAARAASAHDFVSALPDKYDTVVGTSTTTTQLSGGQRQRLCIARALVRDPQILLLDEATSALDNESERAVQAAIDSLLQGSARTSIVVAHRLSTVTKSDRICVLSRGRIVESGGHEELLRSEGGVYRSLWALQDLSGGSGSGSGSSSSSSSSSGLPKAVSGPALASSGGAVAQAAPLATSATGSPPTPTPAAAPKAKGAAPPIAWDVLKDTSSLPQVSRWRVAELQRPEWGMIALALLGSAASGVVQPVFGLVYSQFITVFFDRDDSVLRAKSAEYCGVFVGIAAAVFIATTLRIGAFSLVGEKLTRRLRVSAYRAVLRQPMAFFDAPENSSGRLNTRLSVRGLGNGPWRVAL